MMKSHTFSVNHLLTGLFSLGLCLLAVSCHVDDDIAGNGGRVALTVTAAMGGGTRANGALWEQDIIGVVALDDNMGDYRNVPYSTTAESTSATFTSDSPVFFPDMNSHSFMAYAPYQPSAASAHPGTAADGVVSLATKRQATRQEQKRVDFIYTPSTAAASTSKPQLNMTFRHVMAKLNIIIKAGDGLTAADIQAGSYNLGGAVHKGQFNVTTGAVTANGEAASWSLTDSCLYANTDEGLAFTAILLPQTFTPAFTAVIGGHNYRAELSEITLTAGAANTLTVTVNRSGKITGSVSISEWQTIDEFSKQYEMIMFATDLSTCYNDGTPRTDGQTTANCYLVHKPGFYSFPLYYGNAWEKGKKNESAWKTSETGEMIKSNLVDYNDNAISSYRMDADGAKVIWQDRKGLITKVLIRNSYMFFKVAQGGEGNAVLAATKDGKVVWSWHIWVTSETLSPDRLTVIDTGEKTYKVAPVNLGAHVKNGIGEAFTETFYQFGRKDPMMPTATCYDIDGNEISHTIKREAVSIGTTIQHPEWGYYNESITGPYNEAMINYWDMGVKQSDAGSPSENRSAATVKTVYDPCPPDFCLPTSNLFYYMGSGQISRSSDKVIWKLDKATLYFPLSGYRQLPFTDIRWSNKANACWSANSANTNWGLCYFIDVGRYKRLVGFKRCHEISVRPVAQE